MNKKYILRMAVIIVVSVGLTFLIAPRFTSWNVDFPETELEVQAAIEEIDEEHLTLNLYSGATEEEVIQTMHHMTHQKIKASQKWGAVPMHKSTISQLLEYTEKKNMKKELSYMLERWLNDDFDQIDKDHNYLWSLQGGTIGKANGKLSKREELKFIKKNFK